MINLASVVFFVSAAFNGQVHAIHRLAANAGPSWSNYSVIIYKFDRSVPGDVSTLISNTLQYQVSQYVPGLRFWLNPDQLKPHLIFSVDSSSTSSFCEDVHTPIGQNASLTTTIKIVRNKQINCATQGWVLHLLMHAFGFLHEHQRSDASPKMYLKYTNMEALYAYSSFRNLFLDLRYDGTTDGTAYDYVSVMHYHHNIFAKNSTLRTFLAIPPEVISIRSYGHATNPQINYSVLSSGDIAALRAMFPSSTPAMASATGTCQNGGTWFNFCACRPGYSGRYCEAIEADCYNSCENEGHCMISESTGRPRCFNCQNEASGNYCEQNWFNEDACSACPWWSKCTSHGQCNCEPYPYTGTKCDQPTFAYVPPPPPSNSTTTTATTTITTHNHAEHNETESTPTTTSPTVQAARVGGFIISSADSVSNASFLILYITSFFNVFLN